MAPAYKGVLIMPQQAGKAFTIIRTFIYGCSVLWNTCLKLCHVDCMKIDLMFPINRTADLNPKPGRKK
jgi:hypothetical protein